MRILALCLTVCLSASAFEITGKIKDKDRAAAEWAFAHAEALARSYCAEREAKHPNKWLVRLTGGLPVRLIVVKEPKKINGDLCDGWTDGETVWLAGWDKHLFWHELAHCLFCDNASHGNKETTDVPEEFADYCEREAKRIKKAEEACRDCAKCSGK